MNLLRSRIVSPSAVLLILLLVVCHSVADDRPDVVLIMVDDLRPMLGCYGDRNIKTPCIDSLASRGVVFDRAYCQYAKCGTSRLSLMSGLRPDAIGVFSNDDRDVKAFRRRRSDAYSMARWLKDAGYHTQSWGKIYHDGWDIATDWSVPSTPGRDREMWEVVDATDPSKPTIIAERLACPVIQSPDVPDHHLFAGRMTEQVVATIRRGTAPNPRFLAIGFRRPHLPFVAPKRFFDRYSVDDSWLPMSSPPPANSPVMAWFNSDGYVGSAQRIGLTMPRRPNRQEAIAWNGYEMRSYLGVPKQGEIPRELQLQLRNAYA
ncbi:MAG: sulfatase-like hydrolase/transferase, partial [Pirellulaceae bacterium]|nr:sulfatase-like hydrolase/transferase [Pirellulaceae bacterium]